MESEMVPLGTSKWEGERGPLLAPWAGWEHCRVWGPKLVQPHA